MGFFKMLFLIAAPIGGMTIAAFSLKKQLPKACRLFGNYIGLGYIFFKSVITILKPKDHITYEMIDIARKTSQQSQALRRQLRNTLKKTKDQLKIKKQETFKQFQSELTFLKDKQIKIQEEQALTSNIAEKQNKNLNASEIIFMLQSKRKILLQQRHKKRQSRKFYTQL